MEWCHTKWTEKYYCCMINVTASYYQILGAQRELFSKVTFSPKVLDAFMNIPCKFHVKRSKVSDVHARIILHSWELRVGRDYLTLQSPMVTIHPTCFNNQ
jgi:hypothetical protein